LKAQFQTYVIFCNTAMIC